MAAWHSLLDAPRLGSLPNEIPDATPSHFPRRRNEVSRVRRRFSLMLEDLEGRTLLSGNTPTVTWANPADITYGTPLGGPSSTRRPPSMERTSQVPSPIALPRAPSWTPARIRCFPSASRLTIRPTSMAPLQYAVINVAKGTQTLTFDQPADITYGTPLTGGNPPFSLGQLMASLATSGPAPAGTLTFNPPSGTILSAGNGQVLTVSVAATNDYNPASATTTINVLPAPLTVTADNASKFAGQANPTFTAQFAGFVNGDGPANLGGMLTFMTDASVQSSRPVPDHTRGAHLAELRYHLRQWDPHRCININHHVGNHHVGNRIAQPRHCGPADHFHRHGHRHLRRHHPHRHRRSHEWNDDDRYGYARATGRPRSWPPCPKVLTRSLPSTPATAVSRRVPRRRCP